jgi:hypothetical protein
MAVRFAPDGGSYVLCGQSGRIARVTTDDAVMWETTFRDTGELRSATFSADGSHLLLGGTGKVLLVNAVTGALVQELGSGSIAAAVLVGGGAKAAIANDTVINLVDCATGTIAQTIAVGASVSCLATRGDVLAAGLSDGRVFTARGTDIGERAVGRGGAAGRMPEIPPLAVRRAWMK